MDKKRKDQLTIMLCCLLASFALWIYVYDVQNPVNTMKLSGVPVQIINNDSLEQFKLTILPDQNFTINLTLSGTATDFLSVNRNQFRLVADLSGYGFKKGDNWIPVKITQKPDNVSVVNSETLKLDIKVDELQEKTFPIKTALSGKVKDGYYAFSSSINPSQATVSGAAEYIGQVSEVLAKVNVSDASSDVDASTSLVAVDEAGRTIKEVVVYPQTTDVMIPIRKVKTVGINVKTKGTIGKNLILKSITPVQDKIDIAIDNNANNSGIGSLDTEPIALDNLTDGKTVQVNLVVPDGVRLINSNGTISVKIVIDKIIQKNISVDIKNNNLGDNLNVALDNSKASLVLSGDENIINALKDTDIDCSIDLSNLGEGEYNLPVKVTLPDGVSMLSQSPQTVKATITKK